MTNPRDTEALIPDADATGAGRDDDPLAGRTDVDEYGSDPDVRFPGDSEDPSMSTADASANATHPDVDGDV